jgi:ATPase subunit of ABC transporter with duplicated ATPase domains
MSKRPADPDTEHNMTAPKPAVKPKTHPVIKEYGPNAIDIKDLTFAYNHSGSSLVTPKVNHILQGLNLNLETGSRCLLIGANGR